jgi:hypothetical protein
LDGKIPSDDEIEESVLWLQERLGLPRPSTKKEWIHWTSILFPDIPLKNIETIPRCEFFVLTLFHEIETLHGEEAARKLFESAGRQLSPHDRTVRADAKLLWRYLKPFKRNAQKLARELVDEGSSPSYDAALALVKRVKNPKSKRGKAAYTRLEEEIYWRGTDNL